MKIIDSDKFVAKLKEEYKLCDKFEGEYRKRTYNPEEKYPEACNSMIDYYMQKKVFLLDMIKMAREEEF